MYLKLFLYSVSTGHVESGGVGEGGVGEGGGCMVRNPISFPNVRLVPDETDCEIFYMVFYQIYL